MQYRDYQTYAINSVFKYFEEGNTGNPIVAAPTGVGKSVIIGGFVKEVFRRYPGQRVMMLTHVRELIEQNASKLLAVWPSAPVGIYSAGLGRKESFFPITYAGIASVARNTEQFGHIDLILIDECHLVSPKDNTTYQKVIKILRKINPRIKVIGFTATPWRAGQGLLIEDGLFTDICCDMTGVDAFNWFIDQGYLITLIPKATAIEIDTSGISMQQGDYNLKELQAASNKEAITYVALREAMEYGADRNKWLVFATGIQHAIDVANMLNSIGVEATYVHSKMTSKERDQRLADFRAGKYRAMVNNGILTTGFDDPGIDMIIILRPTQSVGLWVQLLGRGTRPLYMAGFDLTTQEGRLAAIGESSKHNCLVMDFAGNTRRLGPINDPVMPTKKRGGRAEAPMRTCENCGEQSHASLRRCPFCDFVFPIVVKIAAGASTQALIKTKKQEDPITETFQVDRVVYSEHHKDGRPPAIKASYHTGLRKFDEWVCLEHGGFPAKKARDWWRERAGSEPPATTLEAFQRLKELRQPKNMIVWVNKKYPEIMSFSYD